MFDSTLLGKITPGHVGLDHSLYVRSQIIDAGHLQIKSELTDSRKVGLLTYFQSGASLQTISNIAGNLIS